MTTITARRALSALRTGAMKFSVLRESLIALSDEGLACLCAALETAPDLNYGYCFAADLRSLLGTVKCVQRYRATNAPGILCRA